MMENDIAKVLTDEDVSILFASFSDLKELFPPKTSSERVGSFLNKVADTYGLKENRLLLLEFLATTAAMKKRAKIALGEELSKDDINHLLPEFRDVAQKKANIYKDKLKQGLHQTNNGVYKNITGTAFPENKTEPVNKDTCKDIRDMDFETAIHLLPIKIRLHQLWNENVNLPENHPAKISLQEDRCISLNQIFGNESNEQGCNLEKGGFRYTLSQRLVAGDPKDPNWREGKIDDHGDQNAVFQSFAALYVTANALQGQAHITLGATFPNQFEKLKSNQQLFSLRAQETLATCLGYQLKDTAQDVDLAKRIINSSCGKEAADKLLPLLTWFRGANLQTGEVPMLTNQIQKMMDRPKFKPHTTNNNIQYGRPIENKGLGS